MASLGSLQFFIPEISSRTSTAKTAAPSQRPHCQIEKKSTEKFLINFNASFSNFELDTSKGGYQFSHSIKEVQNRIQISSKQQPRVKRPTTRYKSQEYVAPSSITSLEATRNNSDIDNPDNLFEANLRHELQ